MLDFSRPALRLHNTVRGLAGWPGTSASLVLWNEAAGAGHGRCVHAHVLAWAEEPLVLCGNGKRRGRGCCPVRRTLTRHARAMGAQFVACQETGAPLLRALCLCGGIGLRHWRRLLTCIRACACAGGKEAVEVKVVRTRCLPEDQGLYQSLCSAGSSSGGAPVAWAPDGDMLVPCEGGRSVLRVTALQPPTKKAMPARDFRNGLRGKQVLVAQAAAPVSV